VSEILGHYEIKENEQDYKGKRNVDLHYIIKIYLNLINNFEIFTHNAAFPLRSLLKVDLLYFEPMFWNFYRLFITNNVVVHI
jgi:hypothetical protein